MPYYSIVLLRFYKKSDSKGLPKYFQVGTVLDSAYEFYSDRIPTKVEHSSYGLCLRVLQR